MKISLYSPKIYYLPECPFPDIIALTGKKESGKKLLASFLAEKYGYKIFTFSEPIKQICSILGLSHEQLYTNSKDIVIEKLGITGRKFMQIIGDDMIRKKLRSILPDLKECLLITAIRGKITEAKTNNPNVRIVFIDTRLQSEVDLIKEFGGKTMRLHRESHYKYEDEFALISDVETHIDELVVDYEIDNEFNSKEELHESFSKIVSAKPVLPQVLEEHLH